MTVSDRPLIQLREMGQSPWCDQLSREMLESGRLARMVREEGITGLTSNPTIFHKAISSGRSYDAQIRAAAERGLDVKAIYEELAVQDIQAVADLLRPVYDLANEEDGSSASRSRPSSPTTRWARFMRAGAFGPPSTAPT
jgi:transaldolase